MRSKSASDEAMLRLAVEALASNGFARGVGPTSRARIFKEAYRSAARNQNAPGLPYGHAVRLVERWAGTPPFSRRGRPRPLPFRGKTSFVALARAARVGGPMRALKALDRMGLVRQGRDGSLVLRDRALVPKDGGADRAAIASLHAAEFLRVLAHNLTCTTNDLLLQRVCAYDKIGGLSVEKLRRELRREGLRTLERANATIAACDKDRNPRAPGGRRTRVSFGVYMLVEPTPTAVRKKK